MCNKSDQARYYWGQRFTAQSAQDISGSEAAIHAMHNILEADNTDALLLIDASNEFNSLNRASA